MLEKPNLPEGWLSKAINAPEKTYAEITCGAYNPFLVKQPEPAKHEDHDYGDHMNGLCIR